MGKKVNSSAKGKRGENKVVELLKEWWKDDHFQRNWVGSSGAVGTILAGNESIPANILEALSSDIMCPQGFPFSIEAKNYSEVDLYEIVRNPENAMVKQWWMQSKRDAERTKRIPLVLFKEDRKQFYCLFREKDMGSMFEHGHLAFWADGEEIYLATWADFVKNYPKEKVLSE